MAYLLVIMWLSGGASVVVMDTGFPNEPVAITEARNFATCITTARSFRAHFKKEIVKVKCLPQALPVRSSKVVMK